MPGAIAKFVLDRDPATDVGIHHVVWRAYRDDGARYLDQTEQFTIDKLLLVASLGDFFAQVSQQLTPTSSG